MVVMGPSGEQVKFSFIISIVDFPLRVAVGLLFRWDEILELNLSASDFFILLINFIIALSLYFSSPFITSLGCSHSSISGIVLDSLAVCFIGYTK